MNFLHKKKYKFYIKTIVFSTVVLMLNKDITVSANLKPLKSYQFFDQTFFESNTNYNLLHYNTITEFNSVLKAVIKPSFEVDIQIKVDLDNFLREMGNGIGVYYENLVTGEYYSYNVDEVFFAASTIKAPYAMYIYNEIENGNASIDEILAYESRFYSSGAGKIQDSEYGTEYSVSELLEYAIRYSDNIALRMLIDIYGLNGFKNYLDDLGVETSKIQTVTGANLSTYEFAICFKEIYDYIEGDFTYSEKFKTDLLNASNLLLQSPYPIAHKYGWFDDAFHDGGIIYHPDEPYLLVVYTNRYGSSADKELFKTISNLIYNNILN